MRRARERDPFRSRADHEDDTRVRDVVLLAVMLVLLDTDAERPEQRLELRIRCGDPDELRVEAAQVGANLLRRVAKRVDAHEDDGRHFVRGLAANALDHPGEHLQRDWADVRAMGKAEEH